MGSAISTAVGGASGMMGGALANQKEGGHDVGNIYGGVLNQVGGAAGLGNVLQQAMEQQKAGPTSLESTSNVQNNGILGGLYGQGGTLENTIAQEHQQANEPWALTNEDRSAYGQASGDIARQFGQSDQSLSQSLADRGLSNSGVAGAAFSGSQGNKNEQLAGLQMKIANNRQQMNQQKLNSTRSFLNQLGGNANTAINSEQQRGNNYANSYNQVLNNKANIANSILGNYQGQQNEGLQQQQQTEHGSMLSNAFAGGAAGASAGYAAGMAGNKGDKMSGGGISGNPAKSNVFAGGGDDVTSMAGVT